MSAAPQQASPPPFNAAEIGALAHLYRGEMYRSKLWRTRLDATTNWAVVTTGIALSVTYAHEDASPLPLVLVGLLVLVFLYYEGRRYRYFDIWRVRVRIMETNLFGPMLRGQGIRTENRWNHVLADDYDGLYFHISLWEAVGRRLRRNYVWIFAIQLVAYLGKILIHPEPVATPGELWERAAIGPGMLDLASLCAGWDDRPAAELARAYCGTGPIDFETLALCRLHLCIQWLGWSPHWAPPAGHRRDWLNDALRLAVQLGL